MTKIATGWILHPADRLQLLNRFPPLYEHTAAHHVTGTVGSAEAGLPGSRTGEVVGIADDGAGVQALVVRIDGTTERGDGGHYHITWSLAWGRTASESNEVIGAHGWNTLEPIPIALVPGRWQS